LTVASVAVSVFAQTGKRKNADEQPIRISTELVQLDVVVTDKAGRVTTDLTKDDFELYESGKKQVINFFEFVDALNGKRRASSEGASALPSGATVTGQGPSAASVGRIFAFIIDDLTIKYEDLSYIKQMLGHFVDQRMQPNDLVAIVRTVGGKGLLQQFTTDKELLKASIASLNAVSHPFGAFHNPDPRSVAGGTSAIVNSVGDAMTGALDTTGETIDINNPEDDTNRALRAYMSLGTASFVIDSMKQLPGRKSMILVSGGLPAFSSSTGNSAGLVGYFLNQLSDSATRGGEVINIMDIRGLLASLGGASFEGTAAISSMGTGGRA